MSGAFFETFVISEILKSYSNQGLDYRYFVSCYRGKDRKKTNRNGILVEEEAEIDFIIEKDGILYPVGIKKNGKVTAGNGSGNMQLFCTGAFAGKCLTASLLISVVQD